MTTADEHSGRLEMCESQGRHSFRLVWREEALLISEPHKSREDALADMRRLLSVTSTFRACMTVSGLFYFTVQGEHGDVIATSKVHELPSDRDEAQALAARLLRSNPRTLWITCE